MLHRKKERLFPSEMHLDPIGGLRNLASGWRECTFVRGRILRKKTFAKVVAYKDGSCCYAFIPTEHSRIKHCLWYLYSTVLYMVFQRKSRNCWKSKKNSALILQPCSLRWLVCSFLMASEQYSQMHMISQIGGGDFLFSFLLVCLVWFKHIFTGKKSSLYSKM